MSNNNADFYFLKNGGKMGELIRAIDWSKTSLGNPSEWPQSLCTMVAVMLDNPFGMYIAWGSEYIQLYNDSYRPILGATKHPQALGISTRETFSEIWHIIGAMFDDVMKGKAVGYPDFMLPLNRYGYEEECYFDFSYSPIRKNDGEVGGVLVTVIETTNKKKAEERLQESNQRFRNTLKQAPVGITILRGPEYIVEMANDKYLQLVDKKESEFVGRPLFASLPEVEEAVHSLLDNVLDTGLPYHGNELPIPVNRYGKQDLCYFDFLYHPLKDEDGIISGVIVSVTEVTEKVDARKRIEERKRLYETITQNTPDLIYVFNLNYRFSYINEALLKMWGRTWDDAIGKGLLENGYEPWHAEMHEREIDQVIATKKPVRGEVSFPHATLGKRIYDYILVPVIDQDGKVEAVAGTTRDITQQIEARKQIEENEQRLSIVVEASELGIWELNLKTNEPTYSKRYLEILGGYKEDIKLNHSQLLQHLHSDDFPIREKAFNEALITGYLQYEARLIWADKSIHWMQGKGKVFYDEQNKPLKLIGTIRDITEEKNHEEELKESEEQFSTLADNMENLAWLADGDGWIYWYNKRWMEYTGLTLKELEGWGWQKVHHPDHVERIVEISKKIWHINETFELTFPLRRHDGEYRWFLTRGYPVANEDGEIIRWIGTNTDINEQKKAEEQFKVLADQAPMWVWLTDKKVNVLYSNPELLKFLGIVHYTEFTGNLWEQKVHPEDIVMVYQFFSDAVSLQQSFSFEFRVQNAKTQQYEWFYIKAVPRLEDGEFTGFIGTGININEQKLILSQLEYRKALLEAHNEASIDGILLVDTKGKILSYNHRFLEIWNMPQHIIEAKDDDEALTFAFTQLVLPDQFIEKVKWLYEHHNEVSLDELEFKDGKIIERHGYPVAGTDGSFYAWSWMFRDITEQRKYEKIIKESEERFRSLAQTLPQLVWVTDPHGKSEFASYRWKEYSGIEPGGENEWKAIVHPDDYDNINTTWVNSLTTGKIYISDVRLKSKNDEYRWHAVKGEPVLNKLNKIIKWVGAFTDIHDQKIREEKKDEFISIASHEMKTPLTTAKAYLQMLELLLDKNNEDANLFAKKASQSVNRLNDLINELLDVSKLRLGKLNYYITSFNFNDMVESTIEILQLTSSKHIIVKSGNVNDEVTGDKERLQQVVINLLTNAIKYSPGAKKVFISVKQENDFITVAIKDTGIGIAKESLKKIFEKYHRVEEHAIHFQGLGIGLYISYEIIQRHNGKLWAESEPKKGSTFYFTIPINNTIR